MILRHIPKLGWARRNGACQHATCHQSCIPFTSTFAFPLQSQSHSHSRATFFHSHAQAQMRPRIVLGIETSCDDTSVAIVDEHGIILAHNHSSQWHLSQQYGGVFPAMAARYHAMSLPILLKSMETQYPLHWKNIDAIAVTRGPGLAPCLKEGINAAKELASNRSLPLYGVNHVAAHALVAHMDDTNEDELSYPHLAVVVSGGHSEIWIVENYNQISILGQTVDDALGEVLDKTARSLNLEVKEHESLGAALERYAQQSQQLPVPGALLSIGAADDLTIDLPIPMKGRKGCDVSFAGLKSAARRKMEEMGGAMDDNEVKQDFAAAFQVAAFRSLLSKVQTAIHFACANGMPIKHVVLGGGVACNAYLRAAFSKLCSHHALLLRVPRPALCTDNAIMIAWLAHLRIRHGENSDSLDMRYMPQWPVGEYHPEIDSYKAPKYVRKHKQCRQMNQSI